MLNPFFSLGNPVEHAVHTQMIKVKASYHAIYRFPLPL